MDGCQGAVAIDARHLQSGQFVTTVELRIQQNWSEYLTQIIQSDDGWETSTPGIGTTEFYSLYTASDDAQAGSPSSMPLIERPWTDHTQGMLHPTGNPLDVAVDGKGFFAVNGPGGPLYTRNGNFRLATDGRLTSSEGYAVRDRQGAPMVLDATRNIQISNDGTVTQDGVVAGKLEIVDFTSTAGLSKQGSNYFRVNDPAVLYVFRLVRHDGKADFVPYLVDSDSGVGTQVTVGKVSGGALPDIVVGNKKGVFLFTNQIDKLGKDAVEKAAAKPLSASAK